MACECLHRCATLETFCFTLSRFYENVTASTDVKNQKSLRVKLTNDTAGEFMACREGGNKFSFASSPIPLRCASF
jgi:hypothetical protein